MSTSKLIATVCAPALAPADERPQHVLDRLDHLLPEPLNYGLTELGAPFVLKERDAFLQAAIAKGQLPIVCNGVEDRLVSFTGYSIPAILSPASTPTLDVTLNIPGESPYTSLVPVILETMAESMDAYWGVASPRDAAAHIGDQTAIPGLPKQHPLGLPTLAPPRELRDVHIPQRLGWLNYWSSASAHVLKWSGEASETFAITRRFPSGAWLLQLTDAPLDLTQPDHLARLKAAYERFPNLGRNPR